jgi:transposase
MQDTQLYAQILGISAPWSVDTVDLNLQAHRVTVTVSFNEGFEFACPTCQKASPRYDKKQRQWRHLDTCQFETIIKADVPRVTCSEHGTHQVAVSWAEKGSRYTEMFESLVICWLHEATIAAVAEQMNLDWDTVHGIQRRAVERGLARRESLAPTDIMIDETSAKKGHNYLTVVSEGPRILYVSENRDMESIDGFWKNLAAEALAGIRSVSVDLWKAYSSSTLAHVPDAENKLSLDRFHVAGYFGKALDKVRKSEHRALMAEGIESLKGTKYAWLRTSANIDNRSRKSFLEITRSTLKTARAWAMKETAHLLWDYIYMGAAEREWKRLLNWMKRSRLAPMIELADSLSKYLWMILNAVRLKVSSGCAEGNNSRIQKIKKMACGFRNTENFKYAVYFHLGKLDMMPRILPT